MSHVGLASDLELEILELTVENILDVLREVQYSSAYWRELGRRLKPDLDFDAIEANHARVEARLEAVIGRWCRDGEGATWESLAQAVCQCRSGGGKNVAEKISQKTRRLSSPAAAGSISTANTSPPCEADRPTMRQLHCLKGTERVVRIVQEIAPHWEAVALALNLPQSIVAIIARDHRQDVVGACRAALGAWLEGRHAARQPVTWSTLLEALRETGHLDTLASHIQQILT